MSIASRVVEEILKQQMFQVYSSNPDVKFTIEMKPNAVEQLEAVIAEELEKGARAYLKEREGKA